MQVYQVVGDLSFNSRARKGRDSARTVPGRPFGRFNSRARKGRDEAAGLL